MWGEWHSHKRRGHEPVINGRRCINTQAPVINAVRRGRVQGLTLAPEGKRVDHGGSREPSGSSSHCSTPEGWVACPAGQGGAPAVQEPGGRGPTWCLDAVHSEQDRRGFWGTRGGGNWCHGQAGQPFESALTPTIHHTSPGTNSAESWFQAVILSVDLIGWPHS